MNKLINKPSHTPTELIEILKHYNIPCNGVLSIYNIPKLKYGNYIFLMAPTPNSNGHYVSLKIKKKYIEFFDSYGIFPTEQIQDALKRDFPNLHVHWNDFQIQKVNEKHCGLFCIDFLMNKDRKKFINQFKIHQIMS